MVDGLREKALTGSVPAKMADGFSETTHLSLLCCGETVWMG